MSHTPRLRSSFAFTLLGFALALPASAQSIASDKTAYTAGEVAVLTGAGFTPGETVALQVLHDGSSVGDPAADSDHFPWWVDVQPDGSFATSWDVCAGGCCVGQIVAASALGEFGESVRTEFEDNPLIACGPAVASLSANGGSCLDFTAAQSGGPDTWEVAEGGNYSLTLTGVLECGDTVTVFAQGNGVGNFCFIANRLGTSQTYVGSFSMPDPGCSTYSLKYKCGSDCSEGGTIAVRGPTSGCGGVQLRMSTFDSDCNKLADDVECNGCTCTGEPVFDNVEQQVIDLGCNPTFIPGCDPSITAHDDCGPVVVTCGFNEGPLPNCRRGRRVVYTAFNNCGSIKADVLYLWRVDTTAPSFVNPPGDIELGCNPESVPGAAQASATDNCGPAEVTSSTSDFASGCSRSRLITYVATDSCGNTATHVQHIAWTEDTTPPTIDNPPSNSNLGCNPVNIPGASELTASDNCGAASVTSNVSDSVAGCLRTRTITFTAIDGCGNQATHVQFIVWSEDTTPPTFNNPPASTSLGCNPTSIPGPSNVTASDNCGPASVTSTSSDTTNGCSRTRAITYVATDACGNQTAHIQLIDWSVDTTPPTFNNPPGNSSLGCNPTSIPGPSNVTASDNCGTATVTSTSSDSTSGCTRTRTITYKATDNCGNFATHVQLINWTVDTTPPTFNNAPGNSSLSCNPTSIPGPSTVTATDNCGPASVTSSYVDTSSGCTRTRTITYKAKDTCGNEATHVQYINWTVDTTPPTFNSPPSDIDIGCNPTSIPSGSSVTASDNCGTATVTSTYYDSSNGCDRRRKITYKATDSCGNVKYHVQYVDWTVDTTPPHITCCPSDITTYANGQCSKTVSFSNQPSATDNCGCSLTMIPPVQPAGGYPIGTSNAVWTVKDGCGNTSTCTIKVKVLGQICVTKFYDSNANGNRDSGEPGVDGWKIQIRQGSNLIGTSYTNSSGTATFNVPAGSYSVSEATPTQNNWVATRPTSCTVVVDASHCSAAATFGNYCFESPCDGTSISYWCGSGCSNALTSSSNFPGWANALNACNLRKSNGSLFTVSTTNKSSAISSLQSWLAGASSSNMAYMLSAQLAATVLNVTCHKGLNDSDKAVIRGGVETPGNVCIVSFLSTSQSVSCGSPLLSLTSVPGSSSCGCSTNNAMVTIGDLRARAVCLLGAYSTTTSSSTQRTYQECVKAILDMINNDGNPSGSACYPCGGVTHFIDPPGTCCDPSF